MDAIKISDVEDILSMSKDIKVIEVEADTIMRYIYFNKDNPKTKINISELRNVYAKSINNSYLEKRYKDNIFIKATDVRKICSM